MIDDLTPPHWGAEPITTAPERIWLQDNGDFDAASEVTWCQHRIEENDTEYVRADLAAVPAQVKVKPLVWSEVDGDEYAEVCGLVYILYEPSACDETNGWYVLEETTNTAIEADGSIEAAKAAAQADYESRILAALEPVSDPRTADYEQAYQYALTLADALISKHYPDNKDWRPLGDLTGLLTQIDNMVAGKMPDPRDEVIARLVEAATHLCDGIATMLPPLGQSDRVLSLRAAIAAAKAVRHG